MLHDIDGTVLQPTSTSLSDRDMRSDQTGHAGIV